MSVQYRVQISKGNERVDGPDGADLVISVPIKVASDVDFDPTVAFMRGQLKAVGNTGALFSELSSGEASQVIAQLVALDS
ncbi:MAG: hypothetical protein ACO3SZ_04040 [Ilumatobacteraceae bacterium]|nr:hypothetical protein [Actinomycetota bacterium]